MRELKKVGENVKNAELYASEVECYKTINSGLWLGLYSHGFEGIKITDTFIAVKHCRHSRCFQIKIDMVKVLAKYEGYDSFNIFYREAWDPEKEYYGGTYYVN